jgi:hypothetical protein
MVTREGGEGVSGPAATPSCGSDSRIFQPAIGARYIQGAGKPQHHDADFVRASLPRIEQENPTGIGQIAGGRTTTDWSAWQAPTS